VIIADIGFFVALANRADRDHPAALAALETLEEGLVTTWPVVTETTHLLASRLGTRALLAFVASARAEAFSLSLVVLAEARGDGRILSTDRRDFRTYRRKSRKPFKNLLDV
jgi:uncharacterized protein